MDLIDDYVLLCTIKTIIISVYALGIIGNVLV